MLCSVIEEGGIVHFLGFFQVVYLSGMTFFKTVLETIVASAISLGVLKIILAIVIIALISRAQRLLGLVAALLFIAYLAGWIF